jgi:hypothetical protein
LNGIKQHACMSNNLFSLKCTKSCKHVISQVSMDLISIPGDLGTRKRPATNCKIEIHFWFKITQYLINGIRFLFQICPRHSFPCARHRHKVSNSFTKESGRDKWLKVRNWISILLLVPVLLLTVGSPGMLS